ncbi:putative S-adenosylmethionine-dependent methyltransferase Rv3030 [Massilia sp. Bi118]|uniref:class I SAM-dependent methyltransferase n=1 Tax=Massilia sp. Bi118 TaxID=2822346 RepID=UPI001D2CBEEC|nr:class I SAM-dependent methyltransferase [Massilia sp. Bi118]CAH0136643.1 putative S-adenosylmethionine-dependent methyltransferase Rv3030 [Massilia sp. Bi118]
MKDYSLKSGERYSSLDLNLIGGDHLWRYQYVATRMAEQKRPLFGADIFCGAGYGAMLMSQQLDSTILAIDGSAEAIDIANKKLNAPNVIFAAKLFPFELPEAAFDFIASLESMEHVKDFETFFWTLAKALKKGGRLFISAPNEVTMPYTGYIWHYKHFRPEEVRALAEKYGLSEIAAYSTTCQILKDGVARVFYPYQIDSNRPLELDAGDTLFFEFEKK